MKSRRSMPPRGSLGHSRFRARVGAADAESRPTPGWKAHRSPLAFVNPRTPAVPASLDLTLDEYYAAAALVGMLASQAEEPDLEWVCEWSLQAGEKMARASRQRRRKKRTS